jgi:hypothetical protein
MKKKILIIGGGNGGSRFCNALIFNSRYEIVLSSETLNGKTIRLSRRYNLQFELYKHIINSKGLKKIQLVVIATPPGTKLKILKDLINSNYRNPIIFEKPLSLEPRRCLAIINLLSNYKIKATVAYARNFYSNELRQIKGKNNLVIEWPYLKSFKIDQIIHNLPHALNVVTIITKSRLHLDSFSEDKFDYLISGKTSLGCFRIRLFKAKKADQPVINGKKIEWPNYLNIYPKIIAHIFKCSQEEMETTFEQSLNIAEILKKVLKASKR